MTKESISSKAVKPRIAIVGGGISGLSSAFHLHKEFDVTLYERNKKLGGHTDTHTFTIDGKSVRVDSGFIIFCPEFYPNFYAMLKELGVASEPTDMSFSAYNKLTGTIYNATNLNKLFCDRKNLFKLSFWRMVLDIVRFYSQAKKLLNSTVDDSMSVDTYLRENNYSPQFRDDHLLPMISALWSATPERVKAFPMHYIVDFFDKHGLLKLVGRPQWLVVKNGSGSYVEALQKQICCNWRIDEAVTQVKRTSNGVQISTEKGTESYDAVIMATHADISLSLLSDASTNETAVLGDLLFEKNHVVVHTDDSIMHPNKNSWASWNTVVPHAEAQNSLRCCTANYWMNSLQNLDISQNVFTTLNSANTIDASKILAERYYDHPIFTVESVAAQKRLPEINGVNNTYHVGAYWGWAFHEDGARSAFNACQLIKQNYQQPSHSFEKNQDAA